MFLHIFWQFILMRWIFLENMVLHFNTNPHRMAGIFWVMISFVYLCEKVHLKKYFTKPHSLELYYLPEIKSGLMKIHRMGTDFGCNHKSHILFMWIVLCPHFYTFCKADVISVNNLYWILLANSIYPISSFTWNTDFITIHKIQSI